MKKYLLPVILASTAVSRAEDWIKPVVDIRARYEYGSNEGLNDSNALTVRERLGLKTQAWNGLSVLVEGEFSQAAIDEYHGGNPLADPSDPAKTLIADPETNELNQAYVKYEGYDSIFIAGRQRIKYDNDAFVGNVGWRQNEQTFDAFSIVNKSIPGLTLQLAYLTQVNRIFGSDADTRVALNSNVQDLQTSSYFLNASYTGFKGYTLGAYTYIMNFEELSAFDNNTVGFSIKKDVYGVTLYGELAWQDKAGRRNETQGFYYHTTATKVIGGHTFTLGIEHLDNGFKTPLSTLHAFNGYADVFVPGRANGAHRGLTNPYISHTMTLPLGIKWINTMHAMGDDTLSAGYGWEYNSVLNKKFNDNFTAIAKLGWFTSEGDPFVGAAALPDATRFSIEMNYIF